MQVICDNCDEIYFNRIFDPDAQSNILKWSSKDHNTGANGAQYNPVNIYRVQGFPRHTYFSVFQGLWPTFKKKI